MSWTCEECRVKLRLEHSLGWPFFTSYGRCEYCGKQRECENLRGRSSSYEDPLDGSTEGDR